MQYGYRREVPLSFQEAVERIKETLATEGFGVLTEVDVKATLKKKLNVAYENYLILGACNPPLAYRALQAEKSVGLFLPCNVVVYQEGDATVVAAVLPTIAMNMIKNRHLKEIAEEAEGKLKRAVDAI